MSVLKVFCYSEEGYQYIFYMDFPDNYQQLKDCIKSNFKISGRYFTNYYIYWVDAENDDIEINNDTSFNMFRRLSSKKTVFVRGIGIQKELIQVGEISQLCQNLCEEPKDKQEINCDQNNLFCDTVHTGVACVECNILPITGFRYKCLECENYDLCVNCAKKNLHNIHRMIRLSQNLSDIKNRTFENKPSLISDTKEQPYKVDSLSTENSSNDHYNKNKKREKTSNSTSGIFANLFQMMTGMAQGGSNNSKSYFDPDALKTGINILTNLGSNILTIIIYLLLLLLLLMTW